MIKNVEAFWVEQKEFESAEDFTEKTMSVLDEQWQNTDAWQKVWTEISEPLYQAYLLDSAKGASVKYNSQSKKIATFAEKYEPSLITTLWDDPERRETQTLAKFLQDQYINAPGDIFGATQSESYKRFAERFENRFDDLTNAQIRRIQDTYIQRTRNDATLDYMHQAEVKYAKISTVPGACEICKPYEGRAFDVEQQYASTIKDYGKSPKAFTNILKTRSKFVFAGNWTEVQKIGGALPPFHPHCRHSIITIIDPSPNEMLDVISKPKQVKAWIENNVLADGGKMDSDAFSDLGQAKSMALTLDDIYERFDLPKISNIIEYKNGYAGYDNGSNELLWGRNIEKFWEDSKKFKPMTHSVQYFRDKSAATTVHEMGHAFHKEHKLEFDGIYKTEQDLVDMMTS